MQLENIVNETKTFYERQNYLSKRLFVFLEKLTDRSTTFLFFGETILCFFQTEL